MTDRAEGHFFASDESRFVTGVSLPAEAGSLLN